MARALIRPNPDNVDLCELREVIRIGSTETAERCTAIQMLLLGTSREQTCKALIVTQSALFNWIKAFNERSVDGLIAKKRSKRTAIISSNEANGSDALIENSRTTKRRFWTAKAFYGYISGRYQTKCSYQTVVDLFYGKDNKYCFDLLIFIWSIMNIPILL